MSTALNCGLLSAQPASTAAIATATIAPAATSLPVAVQTIVKAMKGRVASAMPSGPPVAAAMEKPSPSR